ncbi:copper chaperone PCu(A)C [Microbulbifer guangxiensis]|uniref:copper chaperone PCu(A)C n=1 Tax=Microbulbifer guangxiensis TaxID=2904249 RepID=UPI001F3906A1|nr:copper chaperone PCu(A)C [Microbulbifer guangxiensis]
MKRITIKKGLLAVALILSVPAASAGGSGDGEPMLRVAGDFLEVRGFVRETLPGLNTSAAYLELDNGADRDLRLVGVQLSNRPGGVASLHTTEERDGISRMRPLKVLPIPAGQTLKMAPGGLHVMLEGVRLRAGDSLSLELQFANGETRAVTLPVRGMQVGNEHHHHHHG